MANLGSDDITSFALHERVSVHLVEEPELELPLALEEEIEYLWQREKAKRNLYNALILCLESHSDKRLFCRFVEYRYFIASRERREIHEQLNLYPIGVGAITLCNGHVLIGKRDLGKSSFGGYLECVPTGSIETRAYQHGEVDFIAQILWELQEEAHIRQASVKEVHPIGLFFSRCEGVYQIGLKLNLDESELSHELEGSSEYPLLRWYSFQEWKNELANPASTIVPLSRALWKGVNV